MQFDLNNDLKYDEECYYGTKRKCKSDCYKKRELQTITDDQIVSNEFFMNSVPSSIENLSEYYKSLKSKDLLFFFLSNQFLVFNCLLSVDTPTKKSSDGIVGIDQNSNDIIPPPPLFPIINPIVCNNNQDIGATDFEYITQETIHSLNSHSTSITIPRLSSPIHSKCPQEMIPSLLPNSTNLSAFLNDENSPVNAFSTLFTDDISEEVKSLSNKASQNVIIPGFSWVEENEGVDVLLEDIWIRKP